MKKISYFIIALCLTGVFSACSDWLDVKPETEERETDLFTSYKGFKEALSGCYVAMADRNAYGEKLTMNDIECLANLWAEPNETNQPVAYNMYYHKYDNDYCKDAFESIYAQLFNVITQANAIIINIEGENANAINDADAKNLVRAEAHAIRAFCQFDILRLFGQMPNGGSKTVRLPYSETADIDNVPSYYSFNDYVTKLIADLDLAESLLKESDPVMNYTFTQLNGFGGDPADLEDDFKMYRQARLNYYAVKALKARIYQYVGQTANAYKEAKAVINAQLNGKSFISLSGVGDISSSYFALPSECLFLLSNSDLSDYAVDIVGGNSSSQMRADEQLHITTDMLEKQLYAGQNTASNNRYLNIWERNTTDQYGNKYPTIKKYYYDTSESYSLTALQLRLEVMPMLRLSELYLIAMECTTDLAEANSLYKTYMASHNVNITDDFASLDEVKTEVYAEYRREFYGEGQMFYTYKRKGETDVLWNTSTMTESQYVLPLPDSEYDPNN